MPYKDPDMRREYMRQYAQRPKQKVYRAVYQKTSKAKAAKKQYLSSEHGRVLLLKRMQRYNRQTKYKCMKQTYRKKHPDIILATHLRSKFGLSINDYTVRLQTQNGVCAICLQPETRRTRSGKIMRLCVDHDHQTGKVRELLCQRCNTLLGAVQDNEKLLAAATHYLERYKE